MNLWTIYHNPRDFPGQYVARLFELDQPTETHHVAPTLAEVRAKIPGIGSLARIERHVADDACIVEVWL